MARRGSNWALASGVCLALELDEAPSHLYRLDRSGTLPVDVAHRDLLLALLHGVSPETVDLDPLYRAVQRGWVQRRAGLDDAMIAERLGQLCAPWAWMAPSGRLGRLAQRLLRASLRAHAQRKVFVQGFGQTPCLPETSVRRAMLCGVQAQRVLCIGDDDLVSIPLALMGHQVVVYDVDDVVLLPFLRRIAREWNLDIRVEARDLSRPQPNADHSFDWVLTDPMSTQPFFEMFLSRALDHLRPGAQIACCVHPSAQDVLTDVQVRMGLDLRAYHSAFSHYYNENFVEDGYQSDMAVLGVTPDSKPALKASEPESRDLFIELDQYRQHAWCELRAGLHNFSSSSVKSAARALLQSGLYATTQVAWFADEQAVGFVATLALGGQLVVSASDDGRRFYFAVTPYHETRDEAAADLLQRYLPRAELRYGNRVVRPQRPTLAISCDPLGSD